VANGIIAYNSLILNAVYEKMMKAGVSEEILIKFARISPIAWSNIAFTGKYNFKKSHENIDVMELAEILASYIESNLDQTV
jgi:predicted oxidoreductase